MFLQSALLVGFASFSLVLGDITFPLAELARIKSLQTSNSAIGSECGCDILSRVFDDKLYKPGSEIYTAESTHFWNARGTLLPKCVFVPTDASEVAQAVVTLGSCKSQFAVRGGGHMPVR